MDNNVAQHYSWQEAKEKKIMDLTLSKVIFGNN